MLIGVGVDNVDIDRFASKLERTPALIDRLFTPNEREMSVKSLAVRFAAKEALIKALGGSDGLTWHDIEVNPVNQHRPMFSRTDGLTRVLDAHDAAWPHLSLTHDGGIATAYVIIEERSHGG